MNLRPWCVLTLLAVAAPAAADNQQPKVDLVIALDISGSMRGLIDATRLQLWNAVRMLSRAQPQPVVRVGLITFGGKFTDPAAGWVKRELDLTTDLDAVSDRLFGLTVRGSNEYVARAVQTATREMAWDQAPSTLKILFVAGNESAEQDPRVGLGAALSQARRRGILVNAIYCGEAEARDARGWRVVASIGGGQFAAIDHTRRIAARVTPYDAQLAALSRELSRTYVAFGAEGKGRASLQVSQDELAKSDGPAAEAERAATKATSAYRNEHWDVLDAWEKSGGKLREVPAALKEMTEEQRARWVADRTAERRRVQSRIADLAARRDAWLATTDPARIPITRPSGTPATFADGPRGGAGFGGPPAARTDLGGASAGGPRIAGGAGYGGTPTTATDLRGASGGPRIAGSGFGEAGATRASDPRSGTAQPMGGFRSDSAGGDAAQPVGVAQAGRRGFASEPAATPAAAAPAQPARYWFGGESVIATGSVTARPVSTPSPPATTAASTPMPDRPSDRRGHAAVAATTAPAVAANAAVANPYTRAARPSAKPAAPAKPSRTTMDDAFSGTLRRQAAENGYTF